MQRTSRDGAQTALLVYNFASAPIMVTLDLKGTGIASPQQPVDLYAGQAASPIDGPSHAVPLTA